MTITTPDTDTTRRRVWVGCLDSYAREIDQDLTTVDTSDGVYIFTI